MNQDRKDDVSWRRVTPWEQVTAKGYPQGYSTEEILREGITEERILEEAYAGWLADPSATGLDRNPYPRGSEASECWSNYFRRYDERNRAGRLFIDLSDDDDLAGLIPEPRFLILGKSPCVIHMDKADGTRKSSDEVDEEVAAYELYWWLREEIAETESRREQAAFDVFLRIGCRLPEYDGHGREAARERIVLAVTGCPRKIWDRWQEHPDVPVFRERRGIPSYFVQRRHLREFAPWVRTELPVAALYVSASGTSLIEFVDARQAPALVAASPPRYESFKEVPKDLFTKTGLRRRGVGKAIRDRQKGVALVRLRSRPGQVYVPLYRLDSAG